MTKIKVISLARSTTRRESFARLNQHIQYEFFDAVDGSKLTKEYIQQSGLFSSDLNYSAGAWGCALSHLTLWDQVIESGEALTVAEDDAIFRHDFNQQIEQAIQSLPDDWDIIVWGWNIDFVLSFRFMPGVSPAVAFFDQDQMRKAIPTFQASTERLSFPRLDKCWGTVGYTISPKGAKNLKDKCFPIRPLELTVPILNKTLTNDGIDGAMNAVYASIQSYVSFPPLIVTENDHAISTIRKQKSALSRGFKVFKQGVRNIFGGKKSILG